jgi:hypothetical protein
MIKMGKKEILSSQTRFLKVVTFLNSSTIWHDDVFE